MNVLFMCCIRVLNYGNKRTRGIILVLNMVKYLRYGQYKRNLCCLGASHNLMPNLAMRGSIMSLGTKRSRVVEMVSSIFSLM